MEGKPEFSPKLISINLSRISEYFNPPPLEKSKDLTLFIFNLVNFEYEWSIVKHYDDLVKFLKKHKKFLVNKPNIPKTKTFNNLNNGEKLDFIEKHFREFFEIPEIIETLEFQEFFEVSFMSFTGILTKRKEGFIKKQTGGRVGNESKLCNCNKHFKRFQKRWMLVRDTGIYLSKDKNGDRMSDYIMFDSKFNTLYFRDTGYKDGILISNSKRNLIIKTGGFLKTLDWKKAIEEAYSSSEYQGTKMYNSLYPPRTLNKVKIYIDGEDYFRKVYKKLKAATNQVFISDWWLSPELYLKRPAIKNPKSKLIDVLKRLAEKGVSIYVHVYKEVAKALPLNSKYTVEQLKAAHPNIRAIRHPKRSIYGGEFLWSHHEKVVCIDQEFAFVGGLDLCYGRMDNKKHKLKDDGKKPFYNGIDYSNSRIKDFTNVGDWKTDRLNRGIEPRMPWHDVSVMLKGDVAYDVSVNYIELWNHVMTDFYGWYNNQSKVILTPFKTKPISTRIEKKFKEEYEETKVGFEEGLEEGLSKGDLEQREVMAIRRQTLVKKKSSELGVAEKIKVQEYSIRGSFIKSVNDGSVECQLLRSAGLWSYGLDTIDRSIQSAYLSLISEANHFIYIENQFFISSTAGDPVKNEIAQALVNKIIERAKSGEAFKVIVVLPLLPGFAGEVNGNSSGVLRIQLHWEYETISRGPNSIYTQLMTCPSIKKPSDHIRFYGLRTHEILGDKPVTEIVYVHSKLMVIDDNKMIIGSANINDRSMMGDHDSEIAVVIHDREKVNSLMNGEKVVVSKVVKDFRIKVFKEFSGEEDGTKLEDPFSNKFLKEWEGTAENNTLKYRSVFGCYPDDTIFDYPGIQRLKDEARIKNYSLEKSQIKGFLVEFPLEFLREQDLRFSATDLENLIPMKSFI